MPRPAEKVQVHLHRIEVPCTMHGTHVYFVGGLDHAADDAAAHLVRTLRRNGHHIEYEASVVDNDALRPIYPDTEDRLDDLPY